MSKSTTHVPRSFEQDFVPIPKTIQRETVIRMLGSAVIAERFFMTTELTDYFSGLTTYALALLGYSWSGENSNFYDALNMHISNLARKIDLFDEPRTEDLGREVLKKWEKEFIMLEKNPQHYE